MSPPAAGRGNLVALATTRATLVVAGLAINIALPRWLPTLDDYAMYQWVWSVVSVAAFGANLGLWQLMTRRVAQDPEVARVLVPVSLRATAGLSVLTGLGIVAYVAIADGRPHVIAAAVLGAATLGTNAGSQLVQASFHGLRRMFLEVPAVVGGRVVAVVGHLALLFAGFGLVPLYGARLLAGVAQLGLLLWVFRRSVGAPVRTVEPGAVRAWIAEGRHYGATVFFAAVAAQADILILHSLSTPEELAIYSAPARILLQLAFVATVLSRGLFPRIAQLTDDRVALSGLLAFQARMLLLVSLPVLAGGAVVATPLMVGLFGERYAPSAWPFLFLLVAVPVRFLNNGYGMALTALDRQQTRARLDTVGAVVNVTANLVAIPWLGAAGAAFTTLLTDLVLHALLRRTVAQEVPAYRELGALARTGLAAACMALVVAAVPWLHVSLRVGLGVACFVGFAWATGAWRRSDLARLAQV